MIVISVFEMWDSYEGVSARIPPSWAQKHRWLIHVVIDPTLFPTLLLIVGGIAVVVRIVNGHTVKFQFSLWDMLFFVFALALCLAEWRFMSLVVPRILGSDGTLW
jgi:hypothetical protein